MGFRISTEMEEKRKKEEALQFVLHKGEEIPVASFEDQSISTNLLEEFRMNSYATDKIFAKLDNETLIKQASYYQGQCGSYSYPAATYNEALIHVIVPELIKRIQQLSEKNE